MNKVHRKPENLSEKSCECMISVHREVCYWSRSDQKLRVNGDLTYSLQPHIIVSERNLKLTFRINK